MMKQILPTSTIQNIYSYTVRRICSLTLTFKGSRFLAPTEDPEKGSPYKHDGVAHHSLLFFFSVIFVGIQSTKL